MKITWADLKVEFNHIDETRLIESWDWLIGTDKTPILMTSIGDLFLTDKNGNCYWLNVGEGILDKVADSIDEFNLKLKDNELVDEWFLIGLVEKLKEKGLELTDKHLYGYKKLPVLGGEYEPDNFELTDIEVHFELSGQIHKQIKDLPDGTKVNIKTIE
ncbi:T6SS immunity protein Tdi1 domain-containing protein [Aestuariivivens marinum]|uniref:T6SS immunity protein Tdi1 domain-containing protein n=1 Tax=Aestuariivivens marinum TaxID=2913555 RepID=UPI001F575FE6|nr:T6SS immunity protein Tdi1 domain-containing protein [Aestuariivivens marinum]